MSESREEQHFSGAFYIENCTYHGEIIHNINNGSNHLFLTTETKDTPIGKTFFNYDVIFGKLDTGTDIALYNCYCVMNHTQGFQFQRIVYRFDYMMFGVSSENNTYNKYVVRVKNALLWSGLSQIESDLDKNGFFFKPLNNKINYQWYGASIGFTTFIKDELSRIPREEENKITERLEISIESEQKRDIQFFFEIRDRLLSMITFATKNNINIEEEYFNDFDQFTIVADDSKMYHKYFAITNHSNHTLYNTHFHDYNFTLKQLPCDVDIADKLNLLEPIFDLYSTLFKYPDMPSEMLFLNVVQALETFHSRFYYDNKKSNYVSSVEQRFSSFENYDFFKSLLLSDTQMDENCSFIILVSRLNDLLIGDYDGLFTEYYLNDPTFAQRIADTRHYYTHYGKNKEKKAFKGRDLIEASYIIQMLLEYNVCKVLGIDIRDKITNSLNTMNYKKSLKRGKA